MMQSNIPNDATSETVNGALVFADEQGPSFFFCTDAKPTSVQIKCSNTLNLILVLNKWKQEKQTC